MVLTDEVRVIFADARGIYAEALERLEEDDIRDAAEKTWCATKRATDALILAFTGTKPRTSGQTMYGIRNLRKENPSIEPLRLRYAAQQAFLHGACFYDGVCEPVDDIIDEIHQTAAYIEQAEALAQSV